jgi:hypothetical protein
VRGAISDGRPYRDKEAMEISGHTTRRTFERYHIIRRNRIQSVGERTTEFYKALDMSTAEKKPANQSPGINTAYLYQKARLIRP